MPRGFDDLQVSLHGRRTGLDKDDFLAARGYRYELEAGSTGTTIPNGGLTSLSSSSGTYSLQAPKSGIEKILTTLTTSTLVRQVTLASGNFQSTAGSSFITASFDGQGETLTLIGLSTALFGVVGNIGVSLST
jgi:hypothetical protein